MSNHSIVFLDCTLRDGGYYNDWDFSIELINRYLKAMQSASCDIVELGLRSLRNDGFKGACAYTTDEFIRSLQVPQGLTLGVMINAVELIVSGSTIEQTLEKLFPAGAGISPISVVRIACHAHEFEKVLPASTWLKCKGFTVGFNLMQIADQTQQEIEDLAKKAIGWPLDVLYFADSMGSMDPIKTVEISRWLRKYWTGPMGIHTHDNMGMALQNSLAALDSGVTWLDSTVTGMGRGPGNAKTEYLALELSERRDSNCNLVPLMDLIYRDFQPMQHRCGWGTNTYYYLAGKYGIHPTYVQEMLSDSRYSSEDVLAAIEHLRVEGGKKFNPSTLDASRHFFQGAPRGLWKPESIIEGREVLLLGAGDGVKKYRTELERFIRKAKPYVLALNTQSNISSELIDARVACHPVRLLADCEAHLKLPQPLVTPASMLPSEVREALGEKELLDFGLEVSPGVFEFHESYAVIPSSFVMAYALAMVACGKASKIYLAGFDGYESDDPRAVEVQQIIKAYLDSPDSVALISVTPSKFSVPAQSIYAM